MKRVLHVCISASAYVMRPGREWACRLASQQSGQSWAYGASALGQQVFFRVCSLLLCLIFLYFLALQRQRPVGAARPTVYAQMENHCCQKQTRVLKCHKRAFFSMYLSVQPYLYNGHTTNSPAFPEIYKSGLEFLYIKHKNKYDRNLNKNE